MGRLRATLSTSDLDRQIQGHVAVAQRAVDQALLLCRTARKGSRTEARRIPRVARSLARAKGALADVGRVTPLYDLADRDHIHPDDWVPPVRVEAPPEPPPAPAPEPEPTGDSD